MAIADYASYVTKVSAPYQRIQDTKINLATSSGRLSSFWLTAPLGGSAPTTAAVPTSATTGAMGQVDSSGVQRIAQVAASVGNWGYLMIVDRLSHQGGLSGIVTTEQTTNLPTAALTRYASGAGVFAGIEIYAQLGTTATTFTASYTNQGGSGGQTSLAAVIGGTAFREAGRVLILPLQDGDTGVQSVESVTVLATTGTAGNFGVTLFKPLLVMPLPSVGSQQLVCDSIQTMCGNMPEIVNGACLQYMIVGGTTGSGILVNAVRIIEE